MYLAVGGGGGSGGTVGRSPRRAATSRRGEATSQSAVAYIQNSCNGCRVQGIPGELA